MKLHWLILCGIAILSFSVMVTLMNFVARKGYPIPFILSGLFLVGAILYIFQTFVATPVKVPISPFIIFLILLMGILSFIGNLAQFQAFNTAPNPGLAIAAISLQAGLIAILGAIFFKSSMTTLQIIGLIICLFGVMLISVGSPSAKSSQKIIASK